MPQIFISYRRNDTAYLAANLSDELQEHFGAEAVFFDVDNIPLGVDFREHIGHAVGQCDVVIAIIGDLWMGIDGQGKRRIDEPSDYVRVEIESALMRKIPVIPVLVGNATMPSPTDLPAAIEKIAYLNGTQIRAGRDLRQHIAQLIQGVETTIRRSALAGQALPSAEPSAPDATDNGDKSPRPSNDISSGVAVVEPELENKALAIMNKLRGWVNNAEFFKEIYKALNGTTDPNLHVGFSIPSDAITNAISSYAVDVSPEDVLLLYDNSGLGVAADGLLLTRDAVHWCNSSGDDGRFKYADIQTVVSEMKSFDEARILINQEEILVSAKYMEKAPSLEFNIVDASRSPAALINLAEALANVIRHLAEYVKL